MEDVNFANIVVGIIITLLLIIIPIIYYLIMFHKDIDWEKTRQFLKILKKLAAGIIIYIAVVIALNAAGVIEVGAIELFFRYWGVPLLIMGYRCAWDRTSDGFIAATILLFFGLIGSGIIIANVHLYIAITIILSIPLSLLGCYIFRDKSQWR